MGCPSAAPLLVALLATAGCGPLVERAPFPARPDSVRPADLLGPYDGKVIDADSVLLADLDRSTEPTQFIKDKVAAGKLGMRTGEGMRKWTPESANAVRERLRNFLAEQAKASRS